MRILTAAMLAATPAVAQDLTPVTFGANWVAQAEHGGFYQAQEEGHYAECGLDVTILPGGPQVNNRAQLLAGKIDFFMGGDLLYLFNAAEQGIPFVAVAAIMQKHPQVIVAHPGAAETFDDLKNLTILVSDTSYQSYYRWMIETKGFTEDGRLPYTFNPAPFLADDNVAMQGYLTSEPYLIEATAGFKPDVFLLADEGYETYATTIETMRDPLETRPEVVQCFVDGSIKGWYGYLYGDRTKADARIMTDNPEMTADKIAYAVEAMKSNGIVDSGEALEAGIGVITEEKVRAFYDQMVEAGVTKPDLDIAAHFTEDFTGKGVGMEMKPAE